jgi:hypothetical protein
VGPALLVVIAVPPPHTTDPGLLASVASRFASSRGLGLEFMVGNGAFYLICLFVKSSPLVGAALCAALLAPLRSVAAIRAVRLPLLVVGFWFAAVVRIDYLQTFYLIPVLPTVCILGSSSIIAAYTRWRRATVVVGAVAATWLAVDHVRCYPDYNLHGYQYTGTGTVAGRAAIGYAGLATIPYDGVQQAFAWMRDNAEAGRVALAYIPYGIPEHVLLEVDPAPRYRLYDGAALASPAALDAADFVVSTFEVEVAAAQGLDTPPLYFQSTGRHGYDPVRLRQEFRRVFVVRRAFGIDVVSIWRRTRTASDG